MKKKFNLICIFFCCTICIIRGEQAAINFFSDSNVSVNIYEPLDGATNFNIISNSIELSKNISVTYKLKVSDFCFIRIDYSNGMSYHLIIIEKDNLDVTFKNGAIILEGSNAGGNIYLNSFKRIAYIDSIFEVRTKQKIDIDGINNDLFDTFWKGFNADLDSLNEFGLTSPEFTKILSKDIGYAVAEMLVQNYSMILLQKKGQINLDDYEKINFQIDSIYQKYTPWNNDIIKYRFSRGINNMYYQTKYNSLPPQNKDELLQKYNTFGPYISFLLASDSIQKPKFGLALLIQYDYFFDEFDKNKMLKFLEEKFPDSDYLQIIKKRIKEIEQNNKSKALNNEIIFIDEQINSLQELFSLHYFEKSRIYIDLWATWCMPCFSEFRHLDKLYPIAEKYDVKLVYLSIDNINMKKRWETDISRQNLKGYHFLLNEPLMYDIKKVIYDNQQVLIPRYVYINEKGEIVNNNAPRPSSINENEVEKMFLGD